MFSFFAGTIVSSTLIWQGKSETCPCELVFNTWNDINLKQSIWSRG